jgi:hypothetical protein
LWMIVRVGWIGVPLTDRSTCGCFSFGAARVEGTAAKARATVATTKAKARIARLVRVVSKPPRPVELIPPRDNRGA